MDLNCGYLVLEATAPPTELHPLLKPKLDGDVVGQMKC